LPGAKPPPPESSAAQDTPGGSREHYRARARCILRSAVGPVAPGWRILYATTVDDSTPATAVATVFAPTDPPAGPRPIITWKHATTGLLQKCMSLLWPAPTASIPWRDRTVIAGWVVFATADWFAA